MHDLALGDLLLFIRVAALGSLSAVARERDVPVSQVSRTLARIEKHCATRLMHRSTHALTLTPEGDTFLHYCRSIAGSLEEMEGAFAHHSGEVSGLVRVAASTVLAQYQLLPSLAPLGHRHPGLRVELVVSDQLADMTREGIDIAIRTGTHMPDTVVARRIGTLSRALYAAPSYLAHKGVPSHPDALRDHWLISNTAAPHLNTWSFTDQGRAFSLPIEGRWRSNSTSMTAGLVHEGLGIGQLARLIGDPMVRAGQLVEVLATHVASPQVPIHAVTTGARHKLPKIRACIEHWAGWLGEAGSSP